MNKLYIFIVSIFFAQFAKAVPGTLVSVDPDSAFQGQNINVTVTYPSGTFFSYASPGSEINLYGPGLPTLTSWYMNSFNQFNDQASYFVQVPLTQTPGIYNVSAYVGHEDQFTGQFVPEDTFSLPLGFIVVETNVYGRLFLDNNGNGAYEPSLGDRLWSNKRIDVSPDNISVYTDYNGIFLLSLPNGSHTIQYTLGPGETITSGNSPAVVNVTPGSVFNLGYIGVQTPPVYQIYTWGSTGRRCNRVMDGYVAVINYGNRTIDATATYIKSSNIDFRSATPPPSLVSGDTLTWNFTNIYPGYSVYVHLVDSIPGAGSPISFNGTAIAYNGAVPVDTASSTYQTVVSCSYDPNDKSVSPPGQSLQNFTLIGEDLFYHINFQNTGNDTAFDVVIRDTLDADLDLSTFAFLGSSSPAIVTIDNNTRVAEFKMNNILLPDSNVNEPGSHGYVDYKVHHVAGILTGTEITNTAYIYFDFNPAIQTNMTLNTLVTTIPVGIIHQDFDKGVKIYPNPITTTGRLVIDQAGKETYVLKIWNELGELLTTAEIQNGEYILSSEKFSAGVYYYQLESHGDFHSGKFILLDK